MYMHVWPKGTYLEAISLKTSRREVREKQRVTLILSNQSANETEEADTMRNLRLLCILKTKKGCDKIKNHKLGYILGAHKKEIENEVTTYLVTMYVFVDLERSNVLSYGN